MSPQLARRVALLGSLALVLFAALFFRLWFLQVLSGDDYVSQAAQNKVRKLSIEAPRGNIVDRSGRVLVKTRQAAVVQIQPTKLPTAEQEVAKTYSAQVSAAERVRLAAVDKLALFDRNLRAEDLKVKKLKPALRRERRVLARAADTAKLPPIPPVPTDPAVRTLFTRLGRVVDLRPREIHQRVLEQYARTPYAAVTVKTDIGRAAFDYLGERQSAFPGVKTQVQYLRTYPFKTLAAQLFGTVNEISPDQLDEKRYKDLEPGARIGQEGLEETYDKYLRGQDGFQRQVIDAFGDPCEDPQRCPGREVKPKQGQQLQLTLDLGLQRAGTEALQRGIDAAAGNGSDAGAFVAMDPRNGAVLAMGSLPSFDANAFAKPISQRDYDVFRNDPARPLVNRATQGAYPTGSTFKVVTAAAGLESGLITPASTVDDPGYINIGTQRFQNAGEAVNGTINLVQAIKVSSDVFFYILGNKMYYLENQVLQTWARKLGFGHTTGIDLPGEFGGLVPDRAYRDGKFAEYQACRERNNLAYQSTEALFACGGIDRPYAPGDNVQLAVGQGDLQATPLQLATAYSAIANGGKLVTPHLGQDIQTGQGIVEQTLPPPAARKIAVSDATLATIKQGLLEAATQPSGTSAQVFEGFPYPVYGKTGTAERPPNPDQSWYACFVEDKARPIVVVVTVEKGGFGAETAAPVARLILSHWFDLKDDAFRAGDSQTN